MHCTVLTLTNACVGTCMTYAFNTFSILKCLKFQMIASINYLKWAVFIQGMPVFSLKSGVSRFVPKMSKVIHKSISFGWFQQTD